MIYNVKLKLYSQRIKMLFLKIFEHLYLGTGAKIFGLSFRLALHTLQINSLQDKGSQTI